MEKKKTRVLNHFCAATLLLFTGLTLFMSSSVIFDWFGIRAKEGQYVSFVVWANFLCGWLYLPAVYGFAKHKNWIIYFLIAALIVLIAAFIGLQFHISAGGNFENKTVKAMVFRISLTLIFTLLAYFKIYRN